MRHLPPRIKGTDLKLYGVRGSMARGLHIDQLLIRTRRVHLTFDDVDFHLDLTPALLHTLHARNLDIGNLRIEVLRRTHAVRTHATVLPAALAEREDRRTAYRAGQAAAAQR